MAQGQQNTYVGTVPQKRMVSDRIINTDPMETPLLTALGMNAESKFKFVNQPGVKYEWLVDTFSPTSDILTTAGAADSTTTALVATDGSKFHVGDIVLLGAEYIWVSAVSTNALTVVRAYGGTQAVHADNSVGYIVSNARIEGAASSDTHYTQPTSMYNYSQILHKSIEISRSDARIKRYGIPNLVEFEIDKKMSELKRQLTQLPYYGTRAAGTATTARGCGGLDTFIASGNEADQSSAALGLKAIEDMVQTCWDAGGNPSLLVCGGWAKRKIASFFEGSVTTERSEKMGGIEITKIQTAMGPTLDVLVDRYCPTTSLYLLDPTEVSFVTVDEFFYEELGKTGDTEAKGQIIGEYGFALAGESHHGKIYGFSTSA
jgi:hypothetical protein